MKKLLSLALCLLLLLSTAAVSVFSVTAADTAAQEDALVENDGLAGVGADADIGDTSAVTPVNLGDSFYAHIRMTNYNDYFITAPASASDTPTLKKFNDYYTQVWQFTRDGSAYRIRSVSLNLYLEMSGSSIKEGCYLDHVSEDNSAAQKWIITKDSTGYMICSSVNTNYSFICVNPTAAASRVVLTAAKNNARSYFNIEKLSISSDLLDTPTVKLTNHVDGVQISWNAVTSATQYRVYRYNDSTKKWVALADVKDTGYIDKTPVSGTTYRYTVKVISPVLSKFQAKSVTYIAAPTVSVKYSATGPVISWKAVTGASKYRVFYHNGTKWKTLTTTSGTSYTYTAFESGKTYKFTVRCLSADGKAYTSAYNTAGVDFTIVKTPEITASIMPFSYELKWAKITGASKYRVYYKSADTNMAWKVVDDTENTSYSFGDTVSNNVYYFTVRALDKNGNLISGFKASKKLTFYEAPCIYDITTTSNTRKLSWYPVDGAASYRIFVWNGQKWKIKGTTESGTTTFSVPVAGSDAQNVCYAVRCLDSSGNYISHYLETVIEEDLRYYFPGEYTSKHKF